MSRALPSDDEVVEWLQDMRRAAGPDADRATALLDMIVGKRDAQYWLDAILLGTPRKTGETDIDAQIHAFSQYEAVVALCEQAGVIGDEAPDDLVPLLRMFLPAD